MLLEEIEGKRKSSSILSIILYVIIAFYRLAWQALGDMSTENSMINFVKLVNKECILFKHTVEAYKADLIEQKRIT